MKLRAALNALLALAAATLLWLALKQPGGPGSADEQPLLTTLGKDAVSRIELRHPRSATMVLERSNTRWRMTQPYAIRADADRVNLLLDFLGARSLARFPVIEGELARYGLAEPSSILILNDQRFEFGIQHPLAPNRYVRSGDTVHLVTDIINQHLNSGVESYVDPRLLDGDFEIAGITVPGLTVEQRDGRLTASTGSESADTVARFIEEWRHARAMEVRARGEEDRNAGATQTARIVSGDGSVIEFRILAREPTLRLGRPDLGIVYEFPAEAAARLMSLGPAARAAQR
ncbi:MAG: DUF4340 domain-containing protein [Gammaproteobacteria bacterium]|nr:DUF4340 domain-containing protein [Gammaproteobacteria bacterium]MCG3145109.1 hypothetical protein [Gammaproteobacteria bacterium]